MFATRVDNESIEQTFIHMVYLDFGHAIVTPIRLYRLWRVDRVISTALTA